MSMDTEEMVKAQPVDSVVLIGGQHVRFILASMACKLTRLQVATRQLLLSSWVEFRPTNL